MCEKGKKVSQWLSSVFGDQPVPQYEVNTRTVDILYQLAVASEKRCTETALLTEDHRQKALEYQADADHLQDVVLQGVGLSAGSLAKPASDYLSSLVSCAKVLGIKDTSLGRFVPAINNLTNELVEAEKYDRRLDRELKAVRKRLADTLVLRKSLQEDLNKTKHNQAIESAKAEERLLNKDFAKAKAKELSFRNDMSTDQLAKRHMENRLSHQSLMELTEKVAMLKQEIVPLTKKLEPYRDLSPNLSLAQVKIEEAKRELAAIDSELEAKVDFMNASISKGRP